jgi:hypothetical protein
MLSHAGRAVRRPPVRKEEKLPAGGIGRQKEISDISRGRAAPVRGVVGWECVSRKVERLGRTIIPARLSGPPRRLKSHRDFVWPKARPVVLD